MIDGVTDVRIVDPLLHAWWVDMYKQDESFENAYKCSKCLFWLVLLEGTPMDNKLYYCPHCGAKMDGGEYDG